MLKIRYYISGHGLGHASRSCQIINTLCRRHPEIAVEVVSTAPAWFFHGFLDPSVPVRPQALDFGVLQRDSLVMREQETLQAYRAFLPERERLVHEEAASLRLGGVSLVAADIPAAAFAAAERAGLCSVGISNFTWDWIYQGLAARFPGYDDVLASLADDYRKAHLLLRLPFHGDDCSARQAEDTPLVARVSPRSKWDIRRKLGIGETTRVGLISFGGFGLGEFDFSALGELKGWVFLTEARLDSTAPNVRSLPPGRFAYPDLVKAADAVITKPGYGIVSECIANGTPALYTRRGDFREQALLIKGLERFGRAREIDNASLRKGRWGEPLKALLEQSGPAEILPTDGDVYIADRLACLVRHEK